MKTLLLAGGVALALTTAGAAHAQYLPAPAYASSGYDYAGAEYRAHHFTLAGVRAGVTVLGVDLDAHAGLDIGAHDWGGGYGGAYAAAPPAYAPPPEAGYGYQGPGYGEEEGYDAAAYAPPPPAFGAAYGGEGYAYGVQPSYAPAQAYGPAYGGYGRSYDVPCGCGW